MSDNMKNRCPVCGEELNLNPENALEGMWTGTDVVNQYFCDLCAKYVRPVTIENVKHRKKHANWYQRIKKDLFICQLSPSKERGLPGD
jgi:hypothetical protein